MTKLVIDWTQQPSKDYRWAEALKNDTDKCYDGWCIRNNCGGWGMYKGDYEESWTHNAEEMGFVKIHPPPHQLGALEDDITELYELTAKAARRLNYDFKHAIDLVPSESLRNGFISRFEMYSTIFEAGSGAKDYRHRLHRTIAELEFKIESLKGQLTEAGINPAPESPF